MAERVLAETETYISRVSISRYETGARKRGNFAKIAKVAEVVGVPATMLLAAPEVGR